jgi:hypothetical protein
MVSIHPEAWPARVRARARSRLAGLARAYAGEEIGLCTPLTSSRAVRKGYDLEEAARKAAANVVGNTQLSYERLVTLYEQVAYLERRDLPGALVECGVWRGGAAAMMAQANLAEGSRRRSIHLFDSFEGMPDPEPDKDGPEATRLMETGGTDASGRKPVNAAAPEEALDLIVNRIGYPEAFVHVHKGWFQDTLPEARTYVGPIALLRVDGDWYDSTKVVFEQLYDLVTPGGVIVIDDYGHFEGCRRATDEFLARHAPDAYLHHIDYTGRYLIKPGGEREHNS